MAERQEMLGPYFLRLGQTDDAHALVLRYHYSHRKAGKIKLVATAHDPGGLFGDLGPAAAACFFSLTYGVWGGKHGEYPNLLELTRLVRRDDVTISLSGLVSFGVKWLKRLRLADLIISYADIQQGHHGGIYQAASWNYHGRREPKVEGFVVDGNFVPRRTVWSRSRFAETLQSDDFEDKWDQGKHLYWKPLTRIGVKLAIELGMLRNFYPRPQRPAEDGRCH